MGVAFFPLTFLSLGIVAFICVDFKKAYLQKWSSFSMRPSTLFTLLQKVFKSATSIPLASDHSVGQIAIFEYKFSSIDMF